MRKISYLFLMLILLPICLASNLSISFISPTPANNTQTNNTFIPITIAVSAINLSQASINFSNTITNFSLPFNSSNNNTVLSFLTSLVAQSETIYLSELTGNANLTSTFVISLGTLDLYVNGNNIGNITTGDTSPKTFLGIQPFLNTGSNNITYTPRVTSTATISNSNISYMPYSTNFSTNITGLLPGTYTYSAFIKDSLGTTNLTQSRLFTVLSLTVEWDTALMIAIIGISLIFVYVSFNLEPIHWILKLFLLLLSQAFMLFAILLTRLISGSNLNSQVLQDPYIMVYISTMILALAYWMFYFGYKQFMDQVKAFPLKELKTQTPFKNRKNRGFT